MLAIIQELADENANTLPVAVQRIPEPVANVVIQDTIQVKML